MDIVVEVHAGEGGEDSKLFIRDLAEAYCKYAKTWNCKVEELLHNSSSIVLLISGEDPKKRFEHEVGKHCVQRIPPTETRGRVHTSTVCVGVFQLRQRQAFVLQDKDIEVHITKGSGPGGQNKNKVSTAVRMIHKPTGTTVFIDGRSQYHNKEKAREILEEKVAQRVHEGQMASESRERREQIGNRSRSGKVRTYNFHKSRCVDHRRGTKTSRVDEVMAGRFELLEK